MHVNSHNFGATNVSMVGVLGFLQDHAPLARPAAERLHGQRQQQPGPDKLAPPRPRTARTSRKTSFTRHRNPSSASIDPPTAASPFSAVATSSRLSTLTGFMFARASTSVPTSRRNRRTDPPISGSQLAIKDVKWSSNHEGEPTIFTACASGQIFQYNTQEESRQINKLDSNPHKNSLLLSGGQEGIVRLFDVRVPQTTRSGQLTFRAFKAFQGNSEGIRDIKWCPKDGFIFACATDSGAILKWDVKKANAPLLKINAHASPRGTSSISWHPDGNHLISGGFDRKCHFWDISTTAKGSRSQDGRFQHQRLSVLFSWRPPLWSATAQGKRAAQVAVSYGDSGHGKKYGISGVHIWDLGRPTMPYKEIDRFDISPSALLWHDQDLLWTAGLDGLFSQCDVAFAPKVMDRQPLSSVDFSPSGDVVMMLEERAHPPRPRPTTAVPEVTSSLVPALLPYSTTPPSGTGTEEPIISLEQAINLTGTFKPQQIMAIGHVPVASKTAIYQYLASHYLEALEKGLPWMKTTNGLSMKGSAGIMDHYARAAETVSQFRLAQTWRILAYAVDLLLTRRSEYHLEMRTTRRKNSKPNGLLEKSDSKANLPKYGSLPQLKVSSESSPRRAPSVSSVESRQTLKKYLLTEEIDSESNAATPLARPADEGAPEDPHQFRSSGQMLTPVQEAGGRKRLDSAPLSEVSHDSQISSTEGYDFYDMEAVDVLPKAIDMPRKRKPLLLEYAAENFKYHEASVSNSSYPPIPPPASTGHPESKSGSGSGSGSRSTPEEEYESRIRGRQLEASPDQKKHSLPRAPVRQDSSDLGEIFMISQTTADSLESDYSPQITHEASQHPIEHPAPRLEVMRSMSPRKTSNERVALGRPEEQTSKTVIETDFMPWPDDPDFPFPLLADAANAKTPLGAPRVRDGVVVKAPRPRRRHRPGPGRGRAVAPPQPPHDQRLFVEAALLRNLCVRDWPNGVDVWGDNYTAIFNRAQQRVNVGFTCSQCHKPREIDRSETAAANAVWKCERCRATMAPCAICGHRDATAAAMTPVPMAEALARSAAGAEGRAGTISGASTPGGRDGGHNNNPPPNFMSLLQSHDSAVPETYSDGCCPSTAAATPACPASGATRRAWPRPRSSAAPSGTDARGYPVGGFGFLGGAPPEASAAAS
ncbi:hypothetical protein PG994_008540 [Apiospora phragmitis]|uniref:Uncharacterized protein n=1 Tax=Apiospora phragmitis TaxID=2905665 RepID=A0ABR1UGS3_9PEZI